jgi:hypothetical protein
MEELLKPDVLVLFLVFVVPGFVAMKTHDLMVPAAVRNFGDSIIEAVSYSMLNLALLFWAISLLHSGGFPSRHPGWYYLAMFGILFVAPVGLAATAQAARGWRLFERFLLHPAPTAWDYFFCRREHLWVLCHLKDGRMIGGVYSRESTTSSYPHPQEIYIEELWRVDASGRFLSAIPQTGGALVRGDECSFIEFFKPSTR